MKEKKAQANRQKERRLLNKMPNQGRAPGEIQGLSKHFKQNFGQGRGQRVKAHQNEEDDFIKWSRL